MDDGAGTVTFTPDTGFTGTSTISYTVNDNDGCTSPSSTIMITVTEGPVANNDEASTCSNNPVTLDVLSNDIAGVGRTLAVATVDLNPGAPGRQTSFDVADQGTFAVDNNGIVTFTPEEDFVGMSTASYTVDNDQGIASNAATITVTTSPVPVAEDDSTATPFETAVAVPVLVNDQDPNDNLLEILSVTDPVNGTVTFTPQGTVIYTPNSGFFGADTFTYRIATPNSNGCTDMATVTVTVGNLGAPPPSHPPTAVADASTTPQDTPVAIPVLPNDYDIDGDTLTIIAVDPVTTEDGTASVNDRGTPDNPTDDFIDYTPAPGFVGHDTFTYTIDDGNGNTDTAIVTVRVTALGADPVPNAAGDSATTQPGVPVPIPVLLNDSHPTPMEPLTITTLTDGAHGTVEVNDDGTAIVYSPTAGFIGHDTFTYTIVDSDGDRAKAAVTVMVVNLESPADGVCLFQVRSQTVTAEEASSEEGDNPAEGAVDSRITHQAAAVGLTLATQQSNQVIAGTAVALAAALIPGANVTLSAPVPIVIANDNAQELPDIVEEQGLKTEFLAAQDDHVVITAAGAFVELPADALAQEEMLEIALVDAAQSSLAPLPGPAAADVWQLAVASGQDTVASPITLRLPYADVDGDGQVDSLSPVIDESTLTLWHYDAAAGWQRLPQAVVIPSANVMVVQTTQLGLFGIFQDDNGSLGAVGNSSDDVEFSIVTSSASAGANNGTWQDIGIATQAPLFVTAWDTTQVEDGDYAVRAVCADNLLALAPFQAGSATGSSGGGSSNCFIATAAYGSPLASQIEVLREFRDAYLLTHAPGRWLVRQYYRLSPPLADFIRDRAGLRTVVRVGLTPLVWTAQGLGHPVSRLLILMGSALCGFLGWVAWKRFHTV